MIVYEESGEVQRYFGGYYEYLSHLLKKDSDGDGYYDEEDLEPNNKFKNPIILIHGRNDNTWNAFGIETYIPTDENKHYDAHTSLNGLYYDDV